MPSWEELRLFVPSFQIVHFTLRDEEADGWSVRVAARRHGDAWAPENLCFYAELSRLEARDVVDAEASRFLEL